jgi:phage terminase Nu1 subunit (DNA packaging protein)
MNNTNTNIDIKYSNNPEIFQILTTAETAEMMKLSPRTLEKWRRNGTGPRFVNSTGRCVRYSLLEIIKYMDKDAVNNTIQARQLIKSRIH